MSAPQNSPQPPVPPTSRNKKIDALIAILVSIIGGFIAGILHRTMEKGSFSDALDTGGGATIGLLIVIFVILSYVWS
ncbi:hypothetical protein [Streptomyces albogriseolus]|uniref:hypothetical protein n=1 Tax=Streptomyces albogriseolus TaxID=1887 RepID=UPI0036879B2A